MPLFIEDAARPGEAALRRGRRGGAAMLLEHLGAERRVNALTEASACLFEIVDAMLAAPETRTAAAHRR